MTRALKFRPRPGQGLGLDKEGNYAGLGMVSEGAATPEQGVGTKLRELLTLHGLASATEQGPEPQPTWFGEEGRKSVVDRIFTRVGAADDLAKGQSTFMVEMHETANILNNATPRSLVVLDEVGRGTSTYDGVSLAWAITELLAETISCRTLFATHYHELTALSTSFSNIKNFNFAVKEWNDEIIFVRQVIKGAADRSYGIQVARLAGLPGTVIDRAKTILERLEADDSSHNLLRKRMKKEKVGTDTSKEDDQLALF